MADFPGKAAAGVGNMVKALSNIRGAVIIMEIFLILMNYSIIQGPFKTKGFE
jgi:hypothetical protein